MSKHNYVVKEGQVEYVEDGLELYGEEYEGCRIKVRLPQDGDKDIKDLPWCHPYMPKTFQSIPKVGEAALVMTSEIGNNESNRFYVGPFLSQPQRYNYDPYVEGRGSAVTLLKGGDPSHILKSVKKYKELSQGAFPNKEDVALIGRKSEDIALKEGEVLIRSGARVQGENGNKDLIGDVIFNTNSPAYLQLKYKQGLVNSPNIQANSVINLVADKINLISHQDHNIPQEQLTNKDTMIDEKELDGIMEKLHQLPYGDLLVRGLNIMKLAVMNHGHNLSPDSPPVRGAYITELEKVHFEEMLSPNVRIN